MNTWLTRLQAQLQPTALAASTLNRRQAAVLILLGLGPEPHILYTRRALHLRRHPGEVCFPGGMWEPEDRDLSLTALRETQEEIGLPASEVQLLGRMDTAYTRAGTPVTPYVGTYKFPYPLKACEIELDAIFLVPLARFLQGIVVREDRFERNGEQLCIPVYGYETYEIWGFTAAVTARLLVLIKQSLNSE